MSIFVLFKFYMIILKLKNAFTIVLNLSIIILSACNSTKSKDKLYNSNSDFSDSTTITKKLLNTKQLWDTTIDNIYVAYIIKELEVTSDNQYPGTQTVLEFRNTTDSFEAVLDTSDCYFLLDDSVIFEGLLFKESTINKKTNTHNVCLVDDYLVLYTYHNRGRYAFYYIVKPDFLNKKLDFFKINSKDYITAKFFDIVIIREDRSSILYCSQPSDGYDTISGEANGKTECLVFEVSLDNKVYKKNSTFISSKEATIDVSHMNNSDAIDYSINYILKNTGK